jgi:hypothetical protein
MKITLNIPRQLNLKVENGAQIYGAAISFYRFENKMLTLNYSFRASPIIRSVIINKIRTQLMSLGIRSSFASDKIHLDFTHFDNLTDVYCGSGELIIEINEKN